MSGIADGNNSRYPSDESFHERQVLLLVAELHKTVLAGFLVLVPGEGVGLAFGDFLKNPQKPVKSLLPAFCKG